MNHTPTRGDTITIGGQSQTLECVVLRFDAHDELVAALTELDANLENHQDSAYARYQRRTIRAVLAKVQAHHREAA